MLEILGSVVALSWPGHPTVIPLSPYLAYQSSMVASVEGVSGTFLFDTGEGVTAISPSFAQRISCRPWGRITGFRMTGESLGSPHCDDLTFTASGQRLSVPSAITLDINDLIGPDIPHLDGAIGLDAFGGMALTIVPRSCIILESAQSLLARVALAAPFPIRIVRDAEGVALAIDGAVPTPAGTAWMELDSGNGGSTVVANYIAPLLHFPQNLTTARDGSFRLQNGIEVRAPVRTRDLIMDGDIGARFLNNWELTADLRASRAWLQPIRLQDCR